MSGQTISRLFDTRHLVAALNERYRFFLAVALAGAGTLAWLARCVNDDAFISFRYARNLAEGHGLVFNAGERVEGYSNFLWTLLMAVPHVAGIDPVGFCFVAGPLLAALTLFFTSRAALAATGSRPAALLVVALLALHPSFLAWATGGLETQLVTALLAAIVWLMLEAEPKNGPGIRRNVVLSLLAAAALMTRLDAAIIVGIALAAVAWRDWAARTVTHGCALRLAALAGPLAALMIAWFCWKWLYYGELLPNTYQAKAGDGVIWPRGFAYLFIFFNSYLLWPFVLLIAFSAGRLAERAPLRAVPLLCMLGAHFAYLVHIGGDFMEFRMLVPILPVLYTLIAWSLFCRVASVPLRTALVMLLLAGALHHLVTFDTRRGIEAIARLTEHLHGPASDWVGVGRTLGRDLGSTDTLVAVTPAGAIPYYSRLPALDMLGLTDRWVARNGLPVLSQPGHRRLAPYSYLVSEGVHLVVGHPWITPIPDPSRRSYRYSDLMRRGYLADREPITFAPNVRVVEVPLDGKRALVALYLTSHPAIDALIAAGRWRAYPISAAGPP